MTSKKELKRRLRANIKIAEKYNASYTKGCLERALEKLEK